MKTKIVSCGICRNIREINYYQKKIGNCRSCASSLTNLGRKHSKETNKKNSELRKGKLNHFYGKKHSKETIDRLKSIPRTEKQRNSARETLKINGNRKSMYECWLNRYGKEIADIKREEYKKKQSLLNSGENNSMYGRPAPIGSGNGWSGWYKGLYFRSILELSYLKHLLDNNIKFESGEKKSHAIEYEIGDVKRNYFPDYLINDDYFVEIKPKSLVDSYVNSIKFKSAKEKLGNKFVILTEKDIDKISDNEIVKLFEDGSLIWLKRYEEKFYERYYKKDSD